MYTFVPDTASAFTQQVGKPLPLGGRKATAGCDAPVSPYVRQTAPRYPAHHAEGAANVVAPAPSATTALTIPLTFGNRATGEPSDRRNGTPFPVSDVRGCPYLRCTPGRQPQRWTGASPVVAPADVGMAVRALVLANTKKRRQQPERQHRSHRHGCPFPKPVRPLVDSPHSRTRAQSADIAPLTTTTGAAISPSTLSPGPLRNRRYDPGSVTADATLALVAITGLTRLLNDATAPHRSLRAGIAGGVASSVRRVPLMKWRCVRTARSPPASAPNGPCRRAPWHAIVCLTVWSRVWSLSAYDAVLSVDWQAVTA
jgi:hypothetical protein